VLCRTTSDLVSFGRLSDCILDFLLKLVLVEDIYKLGDRFCRVSCDMGIYQILNLPFLLFDRKRTNSLSCGVRYNRLLN
jgi:hypothetical protein